MTSTKKALLTIIVSFLLGAVVGYFGFRLIPVSPTQKVARSGFQRLKTDLRERLSLTDVQQLRLDSLLQKRKTPFNAFRDQMSIQYRNMREETRDSIRQILTEEQKARFEVFVKELDQQREKEKGNIQ